MATFSSSFFFLCFLLMMPGFLAFAVPLGESYPCPYICPPQLETQLHMYLHQFPAWGNVSHPNEIVWSGLVVDHWLLTMGPDPSENIVGRARGFHTWTGVTDKDWYISHIYVFEDDSYAGSTIQVLGMLDGEWSIVGGTRAFYNARGYITYKDVQSTVSSITDVVRELDVHIFTLGSLTEVNGGAVPIGSPTNI